MGTGESNMYQIQEVPAWDSKGEPRILNAQCTSLRVYEEEGRLKIASNYPTGNNVNIYVSMSAIRELFGKLPSKFRASSIEGLVSTKRKLLIAFLVADARFSCCVIRKDGYTNVLKPGHPLHHKCTDAGRCRDGGG
jgi:hypothetical protein